jgi:hypothetical protein
MDLHVLGKAPIGKHKQGLRKMGAEGCSEIDKETDKQKVP